MGKAKTLDDIQVSKAIATIESSSTFILRDMLMMMLSFRAGLRAQEIAYLEYADITDVEGTLAQTIQVSKRAAKYGRERSIPMHPELRKLLVAWMRQAKATTGPLFLNQYGAPMTPNAVQKQLGRIYQATGFNGASSHSGRRTFITRASRKAATAGASLRDVQALAGHSSLATTELYIDISERQVELVNLL